MRLILFLLLGLSIANAETIYMSQSGSGSGNGSSTSNRASAAFFNSSSNWGVGAGKISAGDTVSMSGTVTSPLTFQGSGSSGSPITLLFETSAKMSAAFWSTAAISSAQSFITINGGTNGMIEATANGTNLANQTTCIGIYITGGHDITIENLTIDNLYVTDDDPIREGQGIVILGSTGNVTIDHCTMTDADTHVGIVLDVNSSNWIISNNTLSRCNHGMSMGMVTNNMAVSNVQIFGNRMDELGVWDVPEPFENTHHLDGIIMFDETPAAQADPPDYANAGRLTGLKIYGNYIGPDIGQYHTSDGQVRNTAAIFLPDQGHLSFAGVMVYNNLLVGEDGFGWMNGFICIGSNNALVFNNTMVALGLGLGPTGGDGQGINGAVGVTAKNNLYIRVGYPIYAPNGGMTSSLKAVYSPVAQQAWVYTGNGFYYNLPAWQAATGLDANSVVGTPSLDANYVPTSDDTVAKDQGEDLSAYFTTDFNGNIRTGSWDIGAFEYGAVEDTTAPTPSPMTFASAPAASSAYSVTMTATTASDASAVEYYFDETSGHAGGSDSGWQSGTTYEDTGLSPSTLYTYTVQARDAALNQTAVSSAASATTSSATGGTANATTINATTVRVGQ